MTFTKEDSPWLKSKRDSELLKESLKNCTWCEGHIKEIRPDYWECVVCGTYHEHE